MLLDERHVRTAFKSSAIDKFKKITFNNVSFKYPGTEKFILRNVNLEIRSGESVCVVGRNGTGKSTLVKLILGLYAPDEGTISIDDKNISILKNEGASYASAAFQDYAKYSLTLKENIVFENDTADEDIINLLYKVDFSQKELDNLPNGLQTFLNREYDEDGIVLSEGQWQRVAVARAFCHNMPLIILDEPTSSLDPVSEENLYNVINTIKGEKTVIMVSHRLSGVISSDKIFVIDNGMIAGAGTHNELMEKCEIYNKMFNLQANRYLQIH